MAIESGIATLGGSGYVVNDQWGKTYPLISGERGDSNPNNNFLAALPECNVARLTPGLAQTITASPAILVGIKSADGVVNGSAVTFKDGATTIDSYAATLIPFSQVLDMHGAKFNTSLIVDIVVAAGTNLLVFWRNQS